jgi:hypothetical protein
MDALPKVEESAESKKTGSNKSKGATKSAKKGAKKDAKKSSNTATNDKSKDTNKVSNKIDEVKANTEGEGASAVTLKCGHRFHKDCVGG